MAVCGCVASFLVHVDMSLVWLIALGTMGFALAVLGSESNAVVQGLAGRGGRGRW